jgi:hypothetical protein
MYFSADLSKSVSMAFFTSLVLMFEQEMLCWGCIVISWGNLWCV